MNIYDALNEYKQYLLIEKKVSDNTLKNYMRDLEHFINYIQKQNQVVLINQIDKDMIRKYLQQFTSLAASSLSRKMVSLRSFYKFLMKEEIVEKNLMETFDLPKNTKRLPQVLNVEEIKTLLDSIEMDNFKNARTRAMLELLYATGIRVSELCNLKLSQLNLKMKYLNVIGKGDKERLLPLNDYVCKILSCYIYDFRYPKLDFKDNDYLFFNNHCPRAIYLIETKDEKDGIVSEVLKSMFSPQSGDYVTAVDESSLILIKSVENTTTPQALHELAETIVAMMNAEALLDVKVAYGTVVQELKDVSKSYKEAKMALDVGKIFYAEKKVIAYSTLGIGRLIYQLPVNLCKIFIEEIFGDNVPYDLDEETLNTLNKFFENNLNVSETSRQLFVHRNTLVYRIEKIQKSTGLDLRSFDDALTFKIALMVVNYMKYLDNQEY